jgi:hypothetical protein
MGSRGSNEQPNEEVRAILNPHGAGLERLT